MRVDALGELHPTCSIRAMRRICIALDGPKPLLENTDLEAGMVLHIQLLDILTQLGYPEREVTSILKVFRDPILEYGNSTRAQIESGQSKVSMWTIQVLDNRWVALIGKGRPNDEFFDIKEEQMVSSAGQPILSVAIALPGLVARATA